MPQIEKSVKERRSHIMIEKTEAIRQKFLKAQVGKTVEVLFETRHSDGFTEGYTKNYTPVKIKKDLPCGIITKVRLTATDGDFCIGEEI